MRKYPMTDSPEIQHNRPLPRVIAVANQKGGVGKTTTSVNLSACLAELGFRTLLIDLDPQGNASSGVGIETRGIETSIYDVLLNDVAISDCVEPANVKNLFVVPANLDLAGAEIELVNEMAREHRLKRAIDQELDEYDYVIIDCPPSLGLLTVNALVAAREVLVPIQCEYYALEGLSQLTRSIEMIRKHLNPELELSTILLTMYDSRTKLASQVAEEVKTHFPNQVLSTIIPRSVRVSEAPSYGKTVISYDHSSPGAIAYMEAAIELANRGAKRG